MRVAGIQCDLVWEDPAANRDRLAPRVRAAAADGAKLVALPEMWPTGFSMDAARVAEPEGGPSEAWMSGLARETGAAVCGSVAQSRRGGRPRNVFVVALPDGRVERAPKVHPFTFGGEADRYDAGDTARTLHVGGVRVTPLVCYDLRFPEMWTAVAERTDLFVCVANWPTPRAANWLALLPARAIECQAYVLGVNRVGAGGGLAYSGGSRILGPTGAILDGAGSECGDERVVAADVDPGEVASVRTRFPFLADRRPDVYAALRGDVCEVSVDVPAAPDAVWPMVSTGDGLARWLGAAASIDARPGGALRVDFAGHGVRVEGFVTRVVTGSSIAFSWGATRGAPDVPPGSSLVTIDLAARDGGTRVTLRHHGLATAAVRRDHADGWREYLSRLATPHIGA